MSNLPTLPETVRRKLALQWESLIEKCRFTGEHLKLHEMQRSVKARALAQAPQSRRAFLKVNYERSIEQVGIAETTRLATQRFGDVAESYLQIWASTPEVRSEVFTDWLDEIRCSVLADAANLWLKSEWHSAWFERACRPKISDALAAERRQWSAKARELELQRLEGQRVEESPAWGVDVGAPLERGREALERSHRIRGEITESQMRTEEMWRATQDLMSEIRQRPVARSASLKHGLQTHRTSPPDPNSRRGDSQPDGHMRLQNERVGSARGSGGVSKRPEPLQQHAEALGPFHEVSRAVRRRQQKNDEIERVRLSARRMLVDGATHQEVCQRLQNSPRPPRAEWRHLPWDKAYLNERYRASVCKWLSRNCQP